MEYVTASNKFKSPRQRVFLAGLIAWLIVRATVFLYFATPHAHTIVHAWDSTTPPWDWFQSKQKVERGRECSSSAFYFLLGLKTAWDSTNAVVLVCLFFW